MNTDIVQRNDPVLRKQAAPVDPADIGGPKLEKIIAAMKAALDSQKDGVAIAAPQIGVSLRIFVVSGKLLAQADRSYTGPTEHLVFINPEIVRLSKDKRGVEEGCLSVRWLYGTVNRSTRATLRALNERGKPVERGAKGLLAQIFQHETDHLDGVLFIDRADTLWEMSEEEIAELQRH